MGAAAPRGGGDRSGGGRANRRYWWSRNGWGLAEARRAERVARHGPGLRSVSATGLMCGYLKCPLCRMQPVDSDGGPPGGPRCR